MSSAYGVNLSDSMIAAIDEVPDQLVTLSYGAGAKFKAVIVYLILPILFAAVMIIGAKYFSSSLSADVFRGLMITGGLGFIFLIFGAFRANKIFLPKYIFTDRGIIIPGESIDWSSIDHVEVLSVPRSEDKASIVIYLENQNQLGLKIKKHELRMKVSEVLRCHVTNIAFKE